MASSPYAGLLIDGSWVDISSYVRYSNKISTKRGRQTETGDMEESTCMLTLDNRDGRFSPELPTSPYFGVLGRNTQIRVARDTIDDSTYLYLSGQSGTYASAPDSAGVSVTGDLEIQIDVAPDSWRAAQDLCSKYSVTGNQRSWAINIDADGILQYVWSADGTATSNALATAAVDADPGERVAIKVTHDVNNGAAGNDVKFYTATSLAGPWTQLGSTVTGAGTTSIFDGTSSVVVGDIPTSGNDPMTGRVYGFKLLNGIGGSEVANPDFTSEDDQTTTFSDAAGNTWTLAGDAAFIVVGPWRFHGEVAEWPLEADVTGDEVTVTIEAAGQWRRLSQNEEPLRSTMYRAHTNPALTRIKAYWSLEDGEEATQIASNATQVAGFPMRITGTPELAAYDGWTASGAMPTMNGATFTGQVRGYTATGESSVYFFLFVASAAASETRLFSVRTTGTARNFDVYLLTNGNLRVRVQDDEGAAIDDGGGNLDAEAAYTLNGRGFVILGLQLEQDGSDVDWHLTMNDFTNTDLMGGFLDEVQISGTITGKTFGIIRSVTVGSSAVDEVHISHIAVSDEISSFLVEVDDAVRAYNGENPSDRILRLCDEEEIPVTIITKGASGNTVTVGDQRIKTLTELLTEVEDADFGLLHEARERLALAYRTRLSMANQTAALTLSHSSHELGAPLKPATDDALTRNDVTVTRDQGSSARASLDEGPMSTLPPAQGGASRYLDAKTVNVSSDDQLPDQAGFRVRLGTEPGARYPQVVVNLHHPAFTGDPALLAAALAVDIGDRIVITDLPAHLPPDDISLIVRGYSESFDQFTHQIVFNCVPEGPWQWAVADDDAKRAGTAGSETVGASHTVTFVNDAETLNGTAGTSVTVSVPSGTVDGDVMVALIGLISPTTITAPAGWTLIGTAQDAGANTRYAAYYRVASSEPANYAWSWTGSFKNSGWIGSYRGVDTSNPIADFDSNGTSTSGTSFATDAVTIPEPAGFLVVGVFDRHAFTGAATTWTTSDGSDAERYDNGTNAGSGIDISHAVYDSARRLDSGDVTRTLTASQTVSQVATWAIALRPAADLLVATTSGPEWVDDATYPDDFPLNVRVSGAVLEVTGIESVVDTFTRSASSGWDKPDFLHTWSIITGTTTQFSVNGSRGLHTITEAAGNVLLLQTSTVIAEDVEILADIRCEALATGASLNMSVVGRIVNGSSSNFYHAQVSFETDQSMTLHLRRGVTTLTSKTVAGLTHATTTVYKLRLQIEGGWIHGKVWDSSGTEPQSWTLVAYDTNVTGAGTVGARSFRTVGNTNVSPALSWDNFTIVNLQRFTISQTPVNGVVKTIADGEPVQVATRAYVGMI